MVEKSSVVTLRLSQRDLRRVEAVSERLAKRAVRLAESENVSLADAETLLLAEAKRAKLLVDEKPLSNFADVWA